MNLYDYLVSIEEAVPESVVCPQCSREDHPGCMKSLHEEESGPAFLCGHCWTDNERARIATEEAAAVAADPWSAADESGKWVRAERARLLNLCDWTQMPDSPMTETVRAEWATYRQVLRDLTTTFASPDLVVWPVSPSTT